MKLKDDVAKFDTWGMDGYQEGMEARAEIRQLEWVIKKGEDDE